MTMSIKICDVAIVVLSVLVIRGCTNLFQTLDSKYRLVQEAYSIAKSLFDQGRASYVALKQRSLEAIDTYLELASIMHREMARELRAAVIKFYKIKYFQDFTNYVISMDEIVDIIEHCLTTPTEKLEEIRSQFHAVLANFRDVRDFETVGRCHRELPDEVAAAHCILHQAVLFNETMQDSLVKIVEIKTRQHAQDMNTSLFGVQLCINDFVPKFFDQMMLEAYTTSGYLRIINASTSDLLKDKWRSSDTIFPEKWKPLVKLLKEKRNIPKQDPLLLTLLAGNMSSQDIIKTLF